MTRSQLEVDGRSVALTNLEKVLYPDTGTRKFDVVDYYIRIAEAMLPHLASRPVTRKRWPGGTESAPFFEKTLPAGTPDWVARFTIEHAERKTVYPVVRSAADLVWLAQVAALELHVPQWRIDLSDDVDRRTDRIVLDLDPGPGVRLDECARVAIDIKGMLDGAGLPSFPVTSGSKGIHVYARLAAPVRSESARAVAKQIATAMAQTSPQTVTAVMAKAQRDGKVFIDWSQNTAAKTTLAPYSLRGRSRPFAAAPRTWDELTEPGLTQLEFTDVLDRYDLDGDLLAELSGAASPRIAPAPADDTVIDLGEYRKKHSSRSRRASATPPPPDTVAPHPTAPSPLARPTVRSALLELRPMLATDDPIDGLADDWAYEGKWDGFRTLIRVIGGRARLISRSGNDLTGDFPELTVVADCLRRDGEPVDAVLDGEIVAVNSAGITDFSLLASRKRTAEPHELRVHLFDVLYLDGVELWDQPWDVRREVLDSLDYFDGEPLIDVPPLLPGPAEVAVAVARERGWEGVVAKRRAARYTSGRRSPDWRKQKNWNSVEVVIGGYRPGRGSESRIGSLLVGLPAERGLRYLGRVGTGFTDAELDDLLEELRPLQISRCPFVDDIDKPVAGSATWVLPKLVADVAFMDWTSTGHLRHPSWRGIRRDKLPGDL
ncbi:non-homologous end-joining DNA ligase [Gordonia hydrophobica]|uniref:DNA ligase (ATP) n=1 Tax=Gordonia hydrophobica TaxID=40516 RepID=A0ABZ2U5P7_9ACTN|nr:non-homologous end-joining DNA ligase [Gordonia hydrophobica]MBM7365650.1 bifunctional non-homologous end joining protein LigD [Gordonia hydrophobica]